MYTRRALCAALFAGDAQSSQEIADQYETTAEEVERFYAELEEVGIARCVDLEKRIWEPSTRSIDETLERAEQANIDLDDSLYRTTLVAGEAMGLPGFTKAIAEVADYLRTLIRLERARLSGAPASAALVERELELRAKLPNVWNARYVKFLGTSEDEQKAYAIRQAIDRLHRAHGEYSLKSLSASGGAAALAALEQALDETIKRP